MAVEVEHVVGDEDDDFTEEWSRVTPDGDWAANDVLGVGVGREADGSWQMFVNVLEFVREDPLESEFRSAMLSVLRAVPGVTMAEEEDRETFLVEGTPTGDALVRAGAAAIDQFADRLHAHYDNPT